MAETARTLGIDHLGLTVEDLMLSLSFFTDCLGWKQVGGNPDYPSAYISDGTSMITLWQAKTDSPTGFDRQTNIGLHHFALKMESEEALNALFEDVKNWPDVTVEFAPELSGKGPKIHCMVYEPGGNRLELSYVPR
ncbi:Catechol 2,3-dioxygenase [Cohaesibacter sp. ES.047]|uniref:VOC family protein n=1 Tax=Cohaesibacter sp. ES.047 TaxID=1798205 RepID=UPI000BB83DFA|nr:VOC family protein [Cohaesibacter sp. ES.047]SNY92534.1 Catechol 2,3-dioxygenase [Cohaesibacter sp. ES.047]